MTREYMLMYESNTADTVYISLYMCFMVPQDFSVWASVPLALLLAC